jgi:hypothetical protein
MTMAQASSLPPEHRSAAADERRTLAPWREAILTRTAELRLLAAWLRGHAREAPGIDGRVVASTLESVDAHLRAASAIAFRRSVLSTLSGSGPEVAAAHLDAAEVELLRVAPDSYVRGQAPELQARVARELPLGDPRRATVERMTRETEFTLSDREALVAALHAANSEARRQDARVRSFRNALLVAAGMLVAVAAGFAVVGAVNPDLVPMCFTFPESATCPTRTAVGGVDPLARATSDVDIALVELLGVLGGALGAAVSLRALPGTSTPFSVPAALAALKLPTGALTAVLGLLLMRAGFIPGFGSLQHPEEILGWAAVFGVAQQLFTRLVDAQAQSVLGGRTAAGGEAPRDPSTADIDRAVATSLQAALTGPALINFNGAVSVVVEGATRSGEARFRVDLGVRTPVLVVTIGPGPEPDALNAALVVDEGEQAPRVPFVVSVDGEALERGRLEERVELADRDEAKTLSFPLELRPATEPLPLWVRVTQYERLLQIVGLELEAPR